MEATVEKALESIAKEKYLIAWENAKRMEREGGGFHSRLGELFFHADGSNARALIDAFPQDFLKGSKYW